MNVPARFVLFVLLGLVTIAAPGSAKTVSKAAARAALPPYCPLITTSDSCLTRVELFGQGMRRIKPAHGYKCPNGEAMRLPTMITVDLRAGGTCPEEKLFSRPMRLVAAGTTIRRSDGLADFYGTFQMGPAASSGGISSTQVTGCIELMEQVGSHHGTVVNAPRPCEACNQKPHTEGWLMGRGVNGFPTGTLRAIVVASSPFPDPKTLTASFTPTVDGVWIH